MSTGGSSRERVHALAAFVPLALASVVHLVEHVQVFRGRAAWMASYHALSLAPWSRAYQLAVVAGIALWAVFTTTTLLRRGPLPGAARDDDGPLVRGLGALVPWVSPLAVTFVLGHAAWLLSISLGGREPGEMHALLLASFGLPWVLAVQAVGLAAVSLHLAATLPALTTAFDVTPSASGRTSAAIVGAAFALVVFIAFGQLIGYLGTGTGTFWPVAVPSLAG